MTNDTTISTSIDPSTQQLLDALRASEPNAARDLGIQLLETGKLSAGSTLADLGNAVRDHYAQAK